MDLSDNENSVVKDYVDVYATWHKKRSGDGEGEDEEPSHELGGSGDWLTGWYLTSNRTGRLEECPLVSVAIEALKCRGRETTGRFGV